MDLFGSGSGSVSGSRIDFRFRYRPRYGRTPREKTDTLQRERGTTALARRLRANQTDAEGKLWKKLRARQFCGLKFRRQQPIGPYIADFCCLAIGLIIELDGSQHAEQVEEDRVRTEFLNKRGFTVLRYWNSLVLTETDVVLQNIYEAVEELSHHPHPVPLPRGEGE